MANGLSKRGRKSKIPAPVQNYLNELFAKQAELKRRSMLKLVRAEFGQKILGAGTKLLSDEIIKSKCSAMKIASKDPRIAFEL